MDIVSLVFSTIAICLGAFLLLERLNIVRIVGKPKDFKGNFRSSPDEMLGKTPTPPEKRGSTFRGNA